MQAPFHVGEPQVPRHSPPLQTPSSTDVVHSPVSGPEPSQGALSAAASCTLVAESAPALESTEPASPPALESIEPASLPGPESIDGGSEPSTPPQSQGS
jgi:hypothetical protein